MNSEATDILKETALRLGFDRVGVTAAEQPETFAAYRRWIDEGRCAGMNYLAERSAAREHPRNVLPGVRSILVLAVSYQTVLESQNHPVRQLFGIASYARGVDYHTWVRRRLKTLSKRHHELFPGGRCRGTVDTAPLLERAFAAAAGIGAVGKNTMLIDNRPGSTLGSRFFLAALLSTEHLEPGGTVGVSTNPCGDCRKCLDACPTGALVAPYILDARRCLNYWTVEFRGLIEEYPPEIREKLGNRFFGCDTCQDVCPWNGNCPAQPPGTVDPASLDAETFRIIIAGSPLERTIRDRR